MQLRVRYAYDPLLFRSHVESFLAEREAENNLVFGILAGLTDGMQKFSHDRPLFVSVEGNVGIQLVAVRTPPFNLVLSTAKKDEAVSFLAREMHAEGHQLPGVTASSREADVFARAWSGISGSKVRREHSQRIYRLDRAIPPRLVAGHLHSCDEPDIHQATEWMRAFNRDVGENQIPADPRRFIGRHDAALFFWIDGRPVSMTGFSGPTPNGIRIGAVFTPPDLRRRGYASACVAAVSQSVLDAGRKFCFLYADLANPTSNHIYQEIGYQPVCDGEVLRFED